MPNVVSLCQLPTPCHRLDRVSEDLGLDVWIKRDDLTGFAMGGNKGRKLEYLMAEALAAGADTIVTCGAAQSNFVRQLGAACSMLGFRCLAAVMNLPYAAEHGRPTEAGQAMADEGNVVLDRILGVAMVVFPDDDWEVLYAHAEELAANAEKSGAIVYRIPIGGSSPLGAFSFVEAAKEIGGGFDSVVCPSSSGSTHAGLSWAFHGTDTAVHGIACDPEPEIMDDLLRLTDGLDTLTGAPKRLTAADFHFHLAYSGRAYGIASEDGLRMIEYLARREGIFLDPVYSAKAFAGFHDLARRGLLKGKVLFWHTGGIPTLFAGKH